MRVRAIYSNTPPADPCDNYFGEVEDYTVFIKAKPLSQPYSSSYTGTESVSSIPADVVDWVLVQLRNPTTTVIAERAAFFKKDGTVVDLDGTSPVSFENVVAGKYYIAIRHRNHLGVMTEMPILVD